MSKNNLDSPPSHQVNDDVFVEGGPPFCSNLAHVHNGLGVVGIDMENGRIDDSGHISGVGGGAGHSGVRSEADLREQPSQAVS